MNSTLTQEQEQRKPTAPNTGMAEAAEAVSASVTGRMDDLDRKDLGLFTAGLLVGTGLTYAVRRLIQRGAVPQPEFTNPSGNWWLPAVGCALGALAGARLSRGLSFDEVATEALEDYLDEVES